MNIDKLFLENFRNYKYNSWDFIPQVNIILGENAIGKTNILESIYLLTGSPSFRHAKKSDMIMWNSPSSVIKAQVSSRERQFNLELTLPQKSAPFALINRVKKPVAKGLSDVLSCVVFAPNDLFLVSSSPSVRRDFLDRALIQLRPQYATLIKKYTKYLEGKNKILKNLHAKPEFYDVLPEYTNSLALLSAQIITYRYGFLRSILPFAKQAMLDISGKKEQLNIGYKTISVVTNPSLSYDKLYPIILQYFTSLKQAEIASGVTLSGIHKDDLEIEINGKNAKNFASQGQMRSAALSLKLSEHNLFAKENGEFPILLLDDVFSELDTLRREYIMNCTQNGQVIITSCYDEKGGFPQNANIILPNN